MHTINGDWHEFIHVAVSKDFKSANITTIKDLKQNMMTIN